MVMHGNVSVVAVFRYRCVEGYRKKSYFFLICPRLSPQDEEFRARPRLDIIQPLPEGSEEISSDALTVRNFQDNECRDYRLGETIKTAPGEMSRSL